MIGAQELSFQFHAQELSFVTMFSVMIRNLAAETIKAWELYTCFWIPEG